MKVVLLAVGSRGDVQPAAALAYELRRRGHEPVIATLDPYAPFVARWGIPFRSLGPMPGDFGGKKARASARFDGFLGRVAFWALYPKLLERRLQTFVDVTHDADLLVSSRLAIAAPHLAEALGVPHIAAWPVPHTPTSSWADPVLTRNGRASELRRRASWAVEFHLANQLPHRILGRLRSQLGLAPLSRRHLRAALDERTHAILYGVSEALLTRPPDWPDRVSLTGFWFAPETRWSAPEGLTDWVSEPTIAIGFGSMVPRNPLRLVHACANAAAAHGRRAVVCRGASAIDESTLPSHVRVFDELPYPWLLPKVDAVIHHGGVGTSAEALRSCCPQVVVPFAYDQPFWGARLAERGVAARPVAEREATPESLSHALQQALQPAVRKAAAPLAARIRSEHGVRNAVDTMVDVAGSAGHTSVLFGRERHHSVSGSPSTRS